MLAIGLILAGILLRFAPHAPNFTPVAAIALFSGAYLNKRFAFIVPLLLMVISDMFLGLHNVVAFTWGGFILVTFIGLWIKKHKNIFGIITSSMASSVIFYIISNFGVWLMGWYPRNLSGLINCYVMGLPFLRDFTMATLFYTTIFVGCYEFIAGRIKDTKLARVLL
jgi:hypothetical protein